MVGASQGSWPRLLVLGVFLSQLHSIAAISVKTGQDGSRGFASLVLSKDDDDDPDGDSEDQQQETGFYCRLAERIGSDTKWRERGDQVIFMIGDSTMRAQFELLCDLSPRAGIMPSGGARKVEVSWCEVRMPGRAKIQPVFFGRNEASYCDVDLITRMEEVIGRRPDVIYFGGGLHWLHIIPKLPWERPDCWWNLERNLAKFLAAAGARAAAGGWGSVVHMQIHSVCEEKMSGRSLDIARVYHRDPLEAAEDCVRAMTTAGPSAAGAPAGAPALPRNASIPDGGGGWEDACRGSFLFRDGAERLHIRAQRAIKDWEREHRQVLKQVSAWSITDRQCKATIDGLHIPSLVHVEVLALWEALGWAEETPVDYLRAVGCRPP